jgi:hypothetical protein
MLENFFIYDVVTIFHYIIYEVSIAVKINKKFVNII